MAKRSAWALGGKVPVLLAVTGWLVLARPWETRTERAYRVCRDCADLPQGEVDRLVETMRVSPGSRDAKLDVFRRQFDDPTDTEACELCAQAILDAGETTVPR